MRKPTLQRLLLAALSLVLVLLIVTRSTDFANDKKKDPKEIGIFDVAKGVNFCSLEKEIGLGKVLAQEVERQAKIINDPVIAEYVNRVGQNLVGSSDANLPFTIHVIDSDEVNAFALPGRCSLNSGLILKADTGAIACSIGRFERAHRGTLFLDEIGDFPLELQSKRRVLQDRQFERLGGGATIQSDMRVVCATHWNLTEMTEERRFRADLFYRSSVFPIELPSLRDRPADIRRLVLHFAMDYAERMRKPITAISEEFMAAMAHHSWPGNVRELQNFIECSVILSTGAVLNGSLPELPCTIQEGSRSSELSAPVALSARVALKDAERSHILQTLQQTGGLIGGQNGSAGRQGRPRTTLISKTKRLGVDPFQHLPALARTASMVLDPRAAADRCGLPETARQRSRGSKALLTLIRQG